MKRKDACLPDQRQWHDYQTEFTMPGTVETEAEVNPATCRSRTVQFHAAGGWGGGVRHDRKDPT